MSYNTFPTLPGIGWPVKVTPKFKTIVQQAASGAEFRTGLWSSPLHEISVPINFMSQADWNTLLTFFIGQQGALIPFYYQPNNDPTTYLVRFPDGLDFEQFMSQLYRTKTLKLQEVR